MMVVIHTPACSDNSGGQVRNRHFRTTLTTYLTVLDKKTKHMSPSCTVSKWQRPSSSKQHGTVDHRNHFFSRWTQNSYL